MQEGPGSHGTWDSSGFISVYFSVSLEPQGLLSRFCLPLVGWISLARVITHPFARGGKWRSPHAPSSPTRFPSLHVLAF